MKRGETNPRDTETIVETERNTPESCEESLAIDRMAETDAKEAEAR
jgi:hypothetical protein